MNWTPPLKPAELTEERLITAILDGTFPADSNLPAERELAVQLGVTRPTLREALQRLGRDGWLEIRQGKPTRVRNYLQEGNLAVLAAIARHQEKLPADFVSNLLYVRILMAPAYTRLAVERNPQQVLALLDAYPALPETPEAYCTFDMQLHHTLTVASGNPVFTLIWNGFQYLYTITGNIYFSHVEGRQSSQRYYHDLQQYFEKHDAESAARLSEQVMTDSLNIWKAIAADNF
jgi:GntR family negative regulator for fad regulon and positive regulator of fabA